MSSLKLNKITQAMSLSLLMGASLTAAPVAFADDAAADEEVEVIQVRGIRGSLKENINAKRFSNSTVDVITSEDIGKFPDKNVAESLQRVPGVTIQRQFGEGAAVSIRGAGVDLTKTTLNGQNVASTGWFVLEPAKRSFNYELLPSELVGNLEVYKSSRADLAEGGVGGTVVVKTRKPLDLDANTVYASVEASYQTDSEETDPQISGMYSWKNDDETFGVLVAAVAQERSLQRQGNEAFWHWGAGPTAFEQDRKRSALTATFQYNPTEELSFVLNVMDMQMEANNTNYALWLTMADHSWNGEGRFPDAFIGGGAGSGQATSWADATNEGAATLGDLAGAFYQARPREATMDSSVIDLSMDYEGDGFKVHAQVGTTTSSGGTDFEMVVDSSVGGVYEAAIPVVDGRYDFTGGNQTWNLADYAILPDQLGMGLGAKFNKTPKEDDETYAQLDLTFDVEWGAISSVKTGFRYADHESNSRQFFFTQDENFNQFVQSSEYADGTIEAGAGEYSIAKIDAEKFKNWAKASITGQTEDLGSFSEIQEDNFAAYVMADWDAEGARGNFGVRYVSTDATSNYYVDGVAASSEGDYNEVLPSMELVVDLADDVILRTSAARVLARPQYVDMYVNASPIGANDDSPNNQFWVIGNVGLKPFVANQFDLGVEWYFNESSLLSVAYFRKDVKNFVSIDEYTVPASEIDYLLKEEEQAFGWKVQEKQNGKDAEIEGLEFQYQQDFGNGFGALVNYTYTDAGTGEAPAQTSEHSNTFTGGNSVLSDSSEHSYNMTGYFENDTFSVRLSYNWRSEYMIRESGAYGNRLHDDFGSLDLSAVYHVTDNIDLKLDVNNLTEESSVQKGNNTFQTNSSGFASGFPLYEYEFARRINFGASFRF